MSRGAGEARLRGTARTRVPVVPGLEVISELGRGADTVVYRVRRAGTDWAMKLRLGADVCNEGELSAFRREAALLALADHRALPNVHEVGLVEGRPYLIMDLIEGEELTQTLRRGPLRTDAVQRLAVEVAQALSAAHRVGLVHRDVKPHNIMVAADGTARLIDFGLASMRAEHAADTVVGTLAYSAPEQSGVLKRVVDARSDLYSLGVVLFECAVGVPPFASNDVGELLRMHATTPAPDVRTLRPELSPGLAAVIAALLAKDPDDRYASGPALVADLLRLEADPTADLVPQLGSASRVGHRVPFTGRDTELAGLLNLSRRLQSGAGGVAVVRGALGSGRSRLLNELSRRVADDGLPVFFVSADDSAPLAPLRRAVEDYLTRLERLDPADQAASRARLLAAAATAPTYVAGLSPVLADLMSAAGIVADPTELGRLDGLIPALGGFVVDLARRSGAMLVCVDDAERLDGGTQRVLAHLTRATAGAALMVVASVSSEETDSKLARALAPDLVDLTITLGPLDELAVARLIRATAGGLDLDDELVRRLAVRGARTPLEILEYLSAVIDAGLLSPAWGSWVLDAPGLDGLELSSDALGLVLGRVEGLGQDTVDLIEVAAVIGQRFEAGLVSRVAGEADQHTTQVLEAAVTRGVLMPSGDRFAFTHEQTRAALLERLDPGRVRDLHQRAAQELDTGDTAQRYAAARHYLAGVPDRDPDRAVVACVDAARQALAVHAGEEAVEFLERAMELRTRAPHADAPTRAEVRLLLADAYAMCGRLADTVATLSEALADTTVPLERAGILLRTARIQKADWDMAAAQSIAIQGLRELGQAPPASRLWLTVSSLWSYLVGRLVEVTRVGFGTTDGPARQRLQVVAELSQTAEEAALRCGHPVTGTLLSLRALFPAARLGPSLAYVRYRVSRGIVAEMLGIPGAARNFALADRAAECLGSTEVLAVARWGHAAGRAMARDDDEQAMLRVLSEVGELLPVGDYLDGLCGSCFSLLGRGRFQEAHTWYVRATARLGAADLLDHNVELIGLAAAAGLGRVAEADARLHQVNENAAVFASPGLRVNALAMKAIAAVEEHNLHERWDRLAEDASTVHPRTVFAQQRILYAALAYGMLERARTGPANRATEGIADAEHAVRVLRRLPVDPILQAHALVAGADLLLLQGDAREALTAIASADPFLTNNDVPLATYEAARVRARACAELGREDEATAHALFAVSIADQHGWPHRADWVRTEFGRAGFRAAAMATRTPDRPAQAGTSRVNDTGSSSAYGRRLAALERLSLAASRIVDPVQLTRVALDQIITILAAERAFLFLPEGDGNLVPHLGRDAAGQDLTTLTAYGSTLVERVRIDREPLVVTGTDEGAALGSQSAVVHGLRSIMVAPLLLDGRLMGVVYLDSRVAKGMFTAADAGILSAITTYVAAALETTRAAQLGFAVQAAQQQLRVAEIMRDAMTDFTATLDPGDVLSRVQATIARVLGADASHLLVLTGLPPAQQLQMAPGPTPPAGLPVPPGSALHVLLGASTPMVGTGAGGATLLGPDLAGTAAWLAVPLRTRDTAVALLVLTRTHLDAFGAPEVELAAALAAQGMVAHENARLYAEVRHLAATDGLTGVYNRRHFFNLASTVLQEALLRDAPLSAVMLDIDNFKLVNDEHGHPVGDQVIRAVADRLTEITRDQDLLARYGGEEFVLILSHPPEVATQIAERVRSAIADAPIDTDVGPLQVTVSVGIAHRTAADTNPGPLLGRADLALYAAKRAGRNRVSVHADQRASGAGPRTPSPR